MGFPIHDRLGEVDPGLRRKDFSQSVTRETFIQHTKGKSLEQLGSEARSRQVPIGLFNYTVLGGKLLEALPFCNSLTATMMVRYRFRYCLQSIASMAGLEL